jgi:hypothetical protein
MIPVTPGDNIAVVAKVTYRGLDEKAYTTLLRMVLIMTPESVRYFFVETVIDEE